MLLLKAYNLMVKWFLDEKFIEVQNILLTWYFILYGLILIKIFEPRNTVGNPTFFEGDIRKIECLVKI